MHHSDTKHFRFSEPVVAVNFRDASVFFAFTVVISFFFFLVDEERTLYSTTVRVVATNTVSVGNVVVAKIV